MIAQVKWKGWRFSTINILLYFEKGKRRGHNYNGNRIGKLVCNTRYSRSKLNEWSLSATSCAPPANQSIRLQTTHVARLYSTKSPTSQNYSTCLNSPSPPQQRPSPRRRVVLASGRTEASETLRQQRKCDNYIAG